MRCAGRRCAPPTPSGLDSPGQTDGNRNRPAAVELHNSDQTTGADVTTSTTLSADFDVMLAVAAATDTRNEEIRGMLQTFVGRMRAVPPSVWSGLAAARFSDVLDRWNAESLRLHHALARIAETIRHNERVLREVAETHSRHIAAAGDGI
ncbi:hypothetical protein AWC16_02885 [Mycolicibacter longobardus]|uniref:Type VII secretion protein EsxU n=1 Tax=Mycolicibacter longobardus TaxID=1108812 RepID=A0A1X1YRT0_9MYCO|nr:hypothetical protein AWC16_02885 [Mycolicibacter longobardus]